MILIIDKRNTALRYETGCIRLEREKDFQRFPIRQLEQVIIFGNVNLDSSVLRHLAEANVPVALLASRGTPKAALLNSSLATQLPFRQLQHHCAAEPELALKQARYFLGLKIQSYALSEQTLARHYPVDDESLASFKHHRQVTLEKISTVNSVSSLMGLEGQLAHAWFVLLAKSLPYRWKFAGRNRRPPRDPLNAILSLGYTLITSEVHQLLIASGLDPSLGFLHQDTPGRDSLVLDFVEIFRSAVDSFALEWLATATLDDSSFYFREATGCRLSKSTRPLFFQGWSQHRNNWPRPILPELIETIESIEEWPTAAIREVINGQIMLWREFLKDSTEMEFETL